MGLEPLTDTDRRQEGEEVVLLVVNDIPGVPLFPLFWVAEPYSAGTKVTHTTTSRPGAAPEVETEENFTVKMHCHISQCETQVTQWMNSLL